MRTDDPIRDFERYDRRQAEEEKKLPKCDWCGGRIRDEKCYLIDGDVVCEKCIADCHRDTDMFTW
jgi:formylmethanofuran dehydrogenase subunit E